MISRNFDQSGFDGQTIRGYYELRFRKLTLHCDGQQGGCLCFAVLILFGDGKAYLSEEANFPVSRAHLEIPVANFL
jgi:hypothetical protein